MKTNLKLAAAMAVLALAACKKDEIPAPEIPENEVRVQFDMQIGAMSKTVMTEGTDENRLVAWENGDAVGIYVNDAAEAKHYVFDGLWKEASEEDAVYVKPNQTYKFCAWYPYGASTVTAEGLSLTATVLADQSVEGGYAYSDVLVASTAEMEGVSASNVQLQFSHLFSTVEVLVAGELVEAAPLDVRLRNVKPTASINLATKAVTLDETANAVDVVMSKIGAKTGAAGWLYRAAVPAQVVASGETVLEITLDGGLSYIFAPTGGVAYEQGKYRRMVADINRENATLTFPAGSIDPWAPADAVYEKLYLVDNNGAVYDMAETAVEGKYRTSADLASIGTSFTVATKVSGNAPASDARVWEFATPASEGYGLRWLAFDMNSGELTKMINHTVQVWPNQGVEDGVAIVQWTLALVQDCEVEFVGAPTNMEVQGDLFTDVDGTKCRYTGPTFGNYEVWTIDNKYFVMKYQNGVQPAVWLTGNSGSLPMNLYPKYPLNWFNADGNNLAYSAMSMISEGTDKWGVLVYLDANYAFQLFTSISWGALITGLESTTPEPLTVTAENYCVPGTSFTPGLYMVRVDTSAKKVSATPYTGEIPVINASK